MAHFAYTRTPGTWTALSALSHAEMEDIDTKLYKAINGDEGGAWTPSTAIQIGGAGFSFGGATGHRVISGSALYINSGAAFQASSGATFTLDNGVTVSVQAAFVAGGGGTLTGTWVHGGTNNVTGAGHFSFDTGTYAEFLSGSTLDVDVGADVTIALDHNTDHIYWTGTGATARWYTGSVLQTDAGASVTFNSAVTLAGAVTLSGAMTCSEPIDMSSNGTIGWRAFLGTDADIPALSCEAYDQVHVVASTPTANRTYTLIGTAVEGQRFRISYLGASYKVTFVFNGGGDSYELKNVSGSYVFLELVYISGAWRLVNFNKVP